MASSPAGGFFQPSILSPPASSVHSSQASYALPNPRSKPLKLGSSKESAVIRHIDAGILQINRRFAQRASEENAAKHQGGYTSFREAGMDIEKLVEVIWISGTPLLTVDCIAGFPAAPRTMFRLLNKLDGAFASLLQGRDFDTGEQLPGVESGRSMTDTEKVRLKSLVERARIVVVDVMSSGEREEPEDDSMAEDTDVNSLDEDMDFDEDDNSWEMETAKVFDRTVVELGDYIGGEPIGIVTDD